MSQTPSDHFELGYRVRLNATGRKAFPRMLVRTGKIVGLPWRMAGGNTLEVLFDGNKRATRIHRSFLEIDGTKAE